MALDHKKRPRDKDYKKRTAPADHLRGGNPDLMKSLKAVTRFQQAAARSDLELLGRRDKTCPQCGGTFNVTRSQDPLRHCCSKACSLAYKREHGWLPEGGSTRTTGYPKYKYSPMLPEVKMARALRKLASGSLTPQHAAQLRAQVADSMSDLIHDAQMVVLGGKTWTPTQARVFSALMNKVLPDLSASHNINETRTSNPEEMTIEELEALVSDARAAAMATDDDDDGVTIEQTPKEQPNAEEHERDEDARPADPEPGDS